MNRTALQEMIWEQYSAQTSTVEEYLRLGNSAECYVQDLTTFCAEGLDEEERAFVEARVRELVEGDLRQID